MLDLAGVSFLFIKSSGCLLFSLKMFPLPEQCVQERRAVASRGHGRQDLRGNSLQNKTQINSILGKSDKSIRLRFWSFSRTQQVLFFTQKTKNTSYDV